MWYVQMIILDFETQVRPSPSECRTEINCRTVVFSIHADDFNLATTTTTTLDDTEMKPTKSQLFGITTTFWRFCNLKTFIYILSPGIFGNQSFRR